MTHNYWMKRALEIAEGGKYLARPNPLVGAVLVSDNKILAEGFHQQFGTAHAEPNCLNQVPKDTDLSKATLYVTLEPCSHHGKTPPCSDLLIARGVGKVVIATQDPFGKVNGSGIERLKAHGIEVQVGVLQQEARWQNRFFNVAHLSGRPFVALKWACSSDGFMDPKREKGTTGSIPISSADSSTFVHHLRAQFQSIAVGKNTFFTDNPKLDVRKAAGPNPIPVVLLGNHEGKLDSELFQTSNAACLFVGNKPNLEIKNYLESPALVTTLNQLHHKHGIISTLVEGGRKIHDSLLSEGLWDVIYRIVSPHQLKEGLSAPAVPQTAQLKQRTSMPSGDIIEYYINPLLHDILAF